MNKYILGIMAACLLVSCSKNEKTKVCQLSGTTDLDKRKITTYAYMPDKRIQRIENYDVLGRLINYTTFDYSSNKVVKKYVSDREQSEYIYYLNKDGYASMKIGKSNDTTFYEYEQDGFLKSATYFDNITSYVYDEEKRISVSNNKSSFIDTYEYYDFIVSSELKALLKMREDIFGDPVDRELFLGKQTKWALKAKNGINLGRSEYDVINAYEYEFDQDKKLISVKAAYSYKYKYTLAAEQIFVNYNCK